MNDDFLKKVLGERRGQKIVVDETDEEIDRFITTGESERPWQHFELTQKENVLEWIDDPKQISHIQSNLEDFARVYQTMPKPLSVLDVGCYGGYFYDYITKTGFCRADELTYLGVDINPDAIEAARAVHRDTGARFQVGDIFALKDSLGGVEHDIVFCSRLVIHLPYMEKAIRNLYDAASQSCFVILDVGDRTYVQRMKRIKEDTAEEIPYYFRKVSLGKIKEIAGQITSNYRVVAGPGPYSSLILHKESR